MMPLGLRSLGRMLSFWPFRLLKSICAAGAPPPWLWACCCRLISSCLFRNWWCRARMLSSAGAIPRKAWAAMGTGCGAGLLLPPPGVKPRRTQASAAFPIAFPMKDPTAPMAAPASMPGGPPSAPSAPPAPAAAAARASICPMPATAAWPAACPMVCPAALPAAFAKAPCACWKKDGGGGGGGGFGGLMPSFSSTWSELLASGCSKSG